MASTNLPTLMLADEHFDPTGEQLVAKINLPTKSTSYFTPQPGALVVLKGDGGARVVRLGSPIVDRGKVMFWEFTPVFEDDPAANLPIRDLSPAYEPAGEGDGEQAPSLFPAGEMAEENGAEE